MFNKKAMPNIPRPIHNDIKEQQFPDLSGMDLSIPSYNPIVKETPSYPKPMPRRIEEQQFDNPLAKPSTRNMVKDNILFVKIDKYQEAIRTLNLIKEGLMNTEHILGKLQQIKSQEDNEIQQWHEQIKRIKQKVLFIDKNLFEQ
jgi:hypothetical protein